MSFSGLTAATGIKIRVIYLDRGSGDEAVHHDFPEDSSPDIHILYRPGHYDVLYPKQLHPRYLTIIVIYLYLTALILPTPVCIFASVPSSHVTLIAETWSQQRMVLTVMRL